MEKGVSSTISFALILAIILVTAMAAYFWSLTQIDRLGEQGRVNSFRSQMLGLDYALRATAHGDINFQNIFELTIPDGSIYLWPGNDTITLTFLQASSVIGRAGYQSPDNNCSNGSVDFIYDSATNIPLYRTTNNSRVFEGSKGGRGDAEFMICYYNVDLKAGGACAAGRGGPRVLVQMKKVNVTNSKPVVNIDMC